MLHLKSYASSIVLTGLLLQGCGGGSGDAQSSPQEQSSAQVIKTENTVNALSDTVSKLDANSSQADIDAAFNKLKLQLSAPESATTVSAIQRAGVLSKVTDTVKDKLVGALDSNLGDKVTGAAFDVVLNSEGVTVVMLDAARNSETISDVMVNALEANWDLTAKMCPMLRENKEFGEKFTALAEERESVAKFFFERIDANMYNCLADAMLLSNDDAVHDESVSHSTNGYMALLMDRYATDYFITPTGATADRRADKFVSLLLDTGAIADYNSTSKTFTGHGDGNELINEKFFYSLFKTPTTTDAFVSAMDKVDAPTRTMLMDNIFLGAQADKNDTLQGYMNIIAIGSAMYDGMYGVADAEGTRTGAYGFGSYAGAFIGFAGLIPSDRYMTYGRTFINAGYEYAKFHSIDVWSTATDAAQAIWDNYTTPAVDTNSTAPNAPARSAGLGLVSSDWIGDITDLLWAGYDNFDLSISWTDMLNAITDSDISIMDTINNQIDGLKDEGNKAYHTILDGRNENNETVYPTTITNPLFTADDTVYGFHGLVELAIREDMVNTNISATMEEAEGNFTLPPFSELTWSFAYNTATNGAMAYYNNNVDAQWFADLSSNELIRQYFYPDASNVYIPSWMLAIDWLKAADNFNNAEIATTDFDFNAGYFDIYVTSTNPNILTSGSEIDLAQVVSIVKEINVTKVDMGSDSIIAVDENGRTIDGLNLYKVRTVSPEDTQAVLTYLSNLGDSALTAIGLDSSNAANVDTTAAQ